LELSFSETQLRFQYHTNKKPGQLPKYLFLKRNNEAVVDILISSSSLLDPILLNKNSHVTGIKASD
jgi:hypothetical protein